MAATVGALADAAERSPFAVDLVVVDDGSTDGSGEAAAGAAAGRLPCRVLSQPNRGRFRARLAGLEAADGELVLLLDARVRLHADALAFVGERVAAGERVWNGHVDVDASGNPYGAFGNVLVALAWRDYFREPRTTSYGLEDFDRYPKGTTCFLAPRELLLEAFATFSTRYDDLRHANDDTPVLRALAARERIHLSPSFGCTYTPRGSLPSFVRHSLHRGVVFLDGHGRPRVALLPGRRRRSIPVSAALARRRAPPARARPGRGARRRRGGRGGGGRGGQAPVRGRLVRRARARVRGRPRRRDVAGRRARARRRLGAAGVILVVFGTTGELIKLAPVLLRLEARGHRYLLATTGQQVQQIPTFLDGFGLRQPDLWLARGAGGRDLRTNRDIPGWLGRVLATFTRRRSALRRALRDGPGRPARPRPRRHDDDRARRGHGPGAARAGRRTSRAACGASTCAIRSRRSSTAA